MMGSGPSTINGQPIKDLVKTDPKWYELLSDNGEKYIDFGGLGSISLHKAKITGKAKLDKDNLTYIMEKVSKNIRNYLDDRSKGVWGPRPLVMLINDDMYVSNGVFGIKDWGFQLC